MSNEFIEKVRSIGTLRKAGTSRESIEKIEGAVVETKEHWDGQVDKTVTVETVDYKAQYHKTGIKKGQVAEIKRKV